MIAQRIFQQNGSPRFVCARENVISEICSANHRNYTESTSGQLFRIINQRFVQNIAQLETPARLNTLGASFS